MAKLAGAGTAEMNAYSAYVIGSDGHLRHRIDIVCENDDAAKEQAEALVDGNDLELWQQNRKICTFKAEE